MPSASRRIRRADGLQRATALLHREGGQGDVAAALAHLLQSIGPAAVQELRSAGGKADLCHRGD